MWGFLSGSVVQILPVNAGDTSSISGSGRCLEKEISTHSSITAWEISWTEETWQALVHVVAKESTIT